MSLFETVSAPKDLPAQPASQSSAAGPADSARKEKIQHMMSLGFTRKQAIEILDRRADYAAPGGAAEQRKKFVSGGRSKK